MDLRRSSRILGTAAALALLLPAVATAHASRYTTPAATATSGDCSAAFPCRIDYAIEGAADGDQVFVAGGEYSIPDPLDAPAIDITGEPGARPVLTGASDMTMEMLAFRLGGTLSHLSLRGTTPGQDTLVLEHGTAEDLEIVSVDGDGAKIVSAPNTTVLRDTVVRTDTSGSGAAALKVRDGSSGGDVALRNVTAIAPAANAIRCEIDSGVGTLVNVLARGEVSDVDASIGGDECTASYSNLRPDHTFALALEEGMQSADPHFADGAFRTLADSPTVDAGIDDAFVSAADPDGRSRGAAPDIGAYEGEGTAVVAEPTVTPQPAASPEPVATATPTPTPVRGIPAPILGTTIVVAPGQGNVLVRRPGSTRFRKLDEVASLPVGTVVDARRGRISLTTALDKPGSVQTGRFWGSRFKIVQNREERGMTSLALRGGSLSRCPRASSMARASSVAREYPARKVVRSLWARDRGGRFRTYGNNSVATARGTAWVTHDRCDGTYTRVAEGAVAVRDRSAHRTVVVRAGHSYLARR